MEKAFYLQTKAFLEKNSEHIKEIESLKVEVERLTAFTTRTIIPNKELQAQIEILKKAVDASTIAMLKLKELQGKNTYEEINPKNTLDQ
jgi:hypothetical protein